MPQAPQYLADKFESDIEAIYILQKEGRFKFGHDGYIEPKNGINPTDEELDAIDYLILEWDYGYRPRCET